MLFSFSRRLQCVAARAAIITCKAHRWQNFGDSFVVVRLSSFPHSRRLPWPEYPADIVVVLTTERVQLLMQYSRCDGEQWIGTSTKIGTIVRYTSKRPTLSYDRRIWLPRTYVQMLDHRLISYFHLCLVFSDGYCMSSVGSPRSDASRLHMINLY